MKTKMPTLERLSVTEIKRLKDVFIESGRVYAETHPVYQKRTLAWNIVMDYLQHNHAAWMEKMQEYGWTTSQINARLKAVDYVVEGINHAVTAQAA